jgi:hypothetical protein
MLQRVNFNDKEVAKWLTNLWGMATRAVPDVTRLAEHFCLLWRYLQCRSVSTCVILTSSWVLRPQDTRFRWHWQATTYLPANAYSESWVRWARATPRAHLHNYRWQKMVRVTWTNEKHGTHWEWSHCLRRSLPISHESVQSCIFFEAALVYSSDFL